jgi:lipopolysaccharide transport system permease protein
MRSPSPLSAEADSKRDVTVIRPPSGWPLPRLRELTHSLDLIYFLAKRDVTIRYRQTAVGMLWAVLQPLILAGIFALFLGRLAKVPSGGAPYAIFALTGMTIWLFVSGAIARCSDSTLASGSLISKVYFPRIAVPISALVTPMVDFAIAFCVLVAALLITGQGLRPQVLLAPLVFAVAAAVALGVGMWLSAIVVRYRDVSLLVPFMLMVVLFTSPILYPFHLIPAAYRPLYALNPMVGVLETFRWTMLPGWPAPGLLLLIPAATGVLLLVTGVLYFARAEQRFTDVI